MPVEPSSTSSSAPPASSSMSSSSIGCASSRAPAGKPRPSPLCRLNPLPPADERLPEPSKKPAPNAPVTPCADSSRLRFDICNHQHFHGNQTWSSTQKELEG